MTRPTPNTERAQVGATFERVDVVPDTPAWLDERRGSLGASEAAAVLGISPHATPLDVYRGKHGDAREIDPELAFIGHAEELTVGRWLRRFHPELGVLRRGFMARSTVHPWLHASFDRFVVKRGAWVPVQIKTAHQFAASDWADEVPLHVAVQVQAELLVHGGDYAWAVAFVGGRRFHLHRIDRDQTFLDEVLVPQTEAFWREHVEAGVPPEPSSPAEAVSLWQGIDGEIVEADDEVVQLWQQLGIEQDFAKVNADEIERLRLAIQVRMREATTLVAPDGTVLATWKPRRGGARIDTARLRAEHPEIADAYTVTSAPTRTFIRKTIRERATA